MRQAAFASPAHLQIVSAIQSVHPLDVHADAFMTQQGMDAAIAAEATLGGKFPDALSQLSLRSCARGG